MRTRLSRDKSIQINDVSLPKYGNNLNEVWNLKMPSGGWNGRPERIILNDSIDLIHKDNVYEANGTNYLEIALTVSFIHVESKCGEDWFTFDYDFKMIPHNLVSPVGDYNIEYPTGCLYNDQDIRLVVEYGPTSEPYKYSETVSTFDSDKVGPFGSGKWGPDMLRNTGSFTTLSKSDNLSNISWWVYTSKDSSPTVLTYNYSDRYGQGFSGSKTQKYYGFSNTEYGVELCSTTTFGGSRVSGSIESLPKDITIFNKKRIY